jgi:outer membrane protein
MKCGIILLAAVTLLGTSRWLWAQDDTDALSCSNGPPQWEVGLVGVGARLPLYRGSDENKDYVFVLPYLIYRGEIVQIEREGVRGLFYRGKYIETDISMGGNPPVTDGADAREGMPELDPLVEFGPALRLILYRGKRSSLLHIEAAGRAAISVDRSDLGTAYEGKRVILSLVAPHFRLGQGSPWSTGCRAGVDFSDSDYHGYFYDVEADQVLPDREAYHSTGGYSGCYVAWHVTRKLMPGLSASLYMQWDNMDGTAYEDSPLLKTRNSYVIGAAVVWKLSESQKRAEMR